MKQIRDLPVARKFTFAFGIVSVLCVAVGVYSFFTFQGIAKNAIDISDNKMPAMSLLENLHISIDRVARWDLVMVLCNDQDCIKDTAKMRQRAIDSYWSGIKAYEPLIRTKEERDSYEKVRYWTDKYLEISDRGIQLVMQGQSSEATQLFRANSTLLLVKHSLDEARVNSDLVSNGGIVSTQKVRKDTLRAVWITQIITLCTLILCIVVGWTLSQFITRPVLEATVAMQSLAQKDLTAKVAIRSEDEIGSLSLAIRTSIESMRQVLLTISKGSETLAASVEELRHHSAGAKENTEIEAGRASQIAVATQQMTATIGEISANSGEASRSSRASCELATKGGSVMDQTVVTMEQIAKVMIDVTSKMSALAQKSKEIGVVVHVIREISNQTNLLALNAAIEASRAGENGRGFGVVAGEVRQLAERTKNATEGIEKTILSIQQETATTIDLVANSKNTVDSASGMVAKARQSLEEIIQSSKDVDHQVQMIASAATEQAAASQEIASSASEISSLSAASRAASEKIVTESVTLSELAQQLYAVLGEFRLENTDRTPGMWLERVGKEDVLRARLAENV